MRYLICLLLLCGLLAAPSFAATQVGDASVGLSLLGAYVDNRNNESGACSMVSARYTGKATEALKAKVLDGIFDDTKPALTRVADVALAGPAYLLLAYGQVTAVKPLSQAKVVAYFGPGAHLGGGAVSLDLSLLYEPLRPRLTPNGYAAALNVAF